MDNQKDSRTLGYILIGLGVFTLPLGIILIVLGVRKLKGVSGKAASSAPASVSHETAAAAPAPVAVKPAEIHMDIDGSAPTFGSWDVSIHDADGQDVRFDRALFQHIVILQYNEKMGTATVQGSRGSVYETTLDRCTCEDFQRRSLPCKHIYKLAMARGYSPDAFFSARSDVVYYADRCRVYHTCPDCRGLENRIVRRTTVAMAEYQGLHLCKTCAGEF